MPEKVALCLKTALYCEKYILKKKPIYGNIWNERENQSFAFQWLSEMPEYRNRLQMTGGKTMATKSPIMNKKESTVGKTASSPAKPSKPTASPIKKKPWFLPVNLNEGRPCLDGLHFFRKQWHLISNVKLLYTELLVKKELSKTSKDILIYKFKREFFKLFEIIFG